MQRNTKPNAWWKCVLNLVKCDINIGLFSTRRGGILINKLGSDDQSMEMTWIFQMCFTSVRLYIIFIEIVLTFQYTVIIISIQQPKFQYTVIIIIIIIIIQQPKYFIPIGLCIVPYF